MAGFHAETLRLLRRDLAATNNQHARDLARRSKLPGNSKSSMTHTLENRIATAVCVMRDLERFLAFAEAVNRLYIDHNAGLHDDGVQRLDCPDCIGRDGRLAAAEVLSRTPLAVAFGDAEPEGGEPR